MPPGGWLGCWLSAVTWTGCGPGLTPVTAVPPGSLADLLAGRGDLDGAEQILRGPGAQPIQAAARRLAELLAESGDLDGLKPGQTPAIGYAAEKLARLLSDRGDWRGYAPGSLSATSLPPSSSPD